MPVIFYSIIVEFINRKNYPISVCQRLKPYKSHTNYETHLQASHLPQLSFLRHPEHAPQRLEDFF